MTGWHLSRVLALCLVLMAGSELRAQEPGPLASPTERLDYLLSTWLGQSVAHLREVWGREEGTEMRGGNPVLVFEKRIKVRAGLGGITFNGGGGLRCVVRFELDDADEIARWSRQGGGQECWNAWRRYEP